MIQRSPRLMGVIRSWASFKPSHFDSNSHLFFVEAFPLTITRTHILSQSVHPATNVDVNPNSIKMERPNRNHPYVRYTSHRRFSNRRAMVPTQPLGSSSGS